MFYHITDFIDFQFDICSRCLFQKPLRRIHIDEETEITKSTKRSINTLNNVSKIPDTNISANSSVLTETLNSNPISKYKEQFKESIQEEKPKEIVQLVSKVPKDDVKSDAILNIRLEEPKSSIHFYNVWKQLKGNPEKKYEFLKVYHNSNKFCFLMFIFSVKNINDFFR